MYAMTRSHVSYDCVFSLCIVLTFLSTAALSCRQTIPVDNQGRSQPNVFVLRQEDDGRTIPVKIGDIVQIDLVRYGGTGYEWHLDETYKEHFALMKEEREEMMKDRLVGVPIIVRWQLKAVQWGDTRLKCLLYRNWEDKEKAVSSFHVGIAIHQ